MDAENLSALRAEERADLEVTGSLAAVFSVEVTEDEIGGTTETFDEGISYPCNLQLNTQPREQPAGGGQQAAFTPWICFLPWDAVVKPQDVLRIEGVDYQVVGTNGGETNRLVLRVNLTGVK